MAEEAGLTPRISIAAVIDAQPTMARQRALLAVMTLLMLLDGYDVFMIGRVAPEIAREFGAPLSRLTVLITLQQLGLAIGSFAIGPLSDRFGRKRLLVLSVVLFAFLTIATVWARSLAEAAVLRGLAGLFLAGVIPNVAALLTEFTPPHRRAAAVSIAFTGYTAGGAAAAAVTIWLLDRFGWRSAFWVGGIAPLLFLPVVLLVVRESLQFRVARNDADPRIGAALKAIDPTLPIGPATRYELGGEQPARRRSPSQAVADLFRSRRPPLTLLLWLIYFLALGTIALMSAWLPTFLHSLEGAPLNAVAAFTLLSFVGGVGGTTSVGFLMDRFGRVRVLMMLFAVDAVALAGIGLVPFGGWAFTALMLVWGYCQAGGQGGINALCAQAYPPEIRSTGVSWSFGVGRAGGVVLPAMGGAALAAGMGLAPLFLLIGALPLLIAAALVGVGRLDRAGAFGR